MVFSFSSTDRLEDFFQNALVGFHLFDRNQLFLEINDYELSLIGYTREEIVGNKKWSDLIVPDQLERFNSHWFHILHKKTVQNMEYTLVHRDGHHVFVLLNASGNFDEQGNLLNTRGIVVDISLRKNLERALRQSEFRFRSMVDTAQEGIWVIGTDEKVEYANRKMASMLGLELPQDMIGRMVDSFYKEFSPKHITTGSQHEFNKIRENCLIRSDGSLLQVIESSSDLVDDSGDRRGTLKMVTDMSDLIIEQKRQKLAVKILQILNTAHIQENMVKQILEMIKEYGSYDTATLRIKENGTGTSCVIAAMQNGDGCVCGDSLCKTYNLMQSILQSSKTFWTNDLKSVPLDIPGADIHFASCLESGYLSVAIVPLCAEERTIGFLHLADRRKHVFTREDITFIEGLAASIGVALARLQSSKSLAESNRLLQKKNQDLDELNERLRQSDLQKSEFVSMTSHELKVPLSSIIGFSQTLQMRQFPAEETEKYLKIIEKEGKRLNSIISDLLDLSRIEIGSSEMKKTWFDPGRLTQEVIDLLAATVQFEVKVEITDRATELFADRDRIKQVLLNLLSNAAKYGSNDTPVRVSIRVVDGGWVEIGVHDNGPGIPEKDLPHLFQKFYRGQHERKKEGSGLGLAIAREIVKAHKGKIRVESIQGKGASFYFSLPLNASD